MSRSSRRSPFTGCTTVSSDRSGKNSAHRSHRMMERIALAEMIGRPVRFVLADADEVEFRHVNELSTPWDHPKDGKRRFDPVVDSKRLRK